METKPTKKGIPTPVKILLIVLVAIVSAKTFFSIALIGIVFLFSFTEEPEIHEDIENYEDYMSFNVTPEDYQWSKWSMDEEIWPHEIKDYMDVKDYKMVYYDPWDKQYVGYMVVDYPEAEYKKESERLKSYPSTEYIGYYGVEEEKTYDLLAVNADPYYGFIYALTDGQGRIIYGEQIFCNYYLDLDYEKYIPEEYLLDGFDATDDNEYEKIMRQQKQ